MEDLRQMDNTKQTYNSISLITLHVINNLLAHRWPPMFSERAVYTELELC